MLFQGWPCSWGVALRNISHVSPPGPKTAIAVLTCTSSHKPLGAGKRGERPSPFTCSLHWEGKISQKRLRCILLVFHGPELCHTHTAVSGRDEEDYYDRDWFRSIKFHPLGVGGGAPLLWCHNLNQLESVQQEKGQLPLGRCWQHLPQCLGEPMKNVFG